MTDMEQFFSKTRQHTGDVYVADYTQYSKDHPTYMKGVEISDEKPDDIESLAFLNPNNVPVVSVNFEENKQFFRTGDNNQIHSSCECMLVSAQCSARKRWLALVELKYCKSADRNIASNFEDAISQLETTFIYLKVTKNVFSQDEYRYFWVVSMPEHSEKAPFSAFAWSQDDALRYQDLYKVTIYSDNQVEIWTSSVLKPKKQ